MQYIIRSVIPSFCKRTRKIYCDISDLNGSSSTPFVVTQSCRLTSSFLFGIILFLSYTILISLTGNSMLVKFCQTHIAV
jgi:hypothetical protein